MTCNALFITSTSLVDCVDGGETVLNCSRPLPLPQELILLLLFMLPRVSNCFTPPSTHTLNKDSF